MLLQPDQQSSRVHWLFALLALPALLLPHLRWQSDRQLTENVSHSSCSSRSIHFSFDAYALLAPEQNFPNPFNPSTTIGYSLPIDANVKLAIYDVLGREIQVLQSGVQAAGTHRVIWDGRDSDNEHVPSGVYLYRLTAGSFELTRKIVVVR
jgi:hypothetical protein